MSEHPETAPTPAASLMRLLWGYRVSQALQVAARLGIFDVIGDGSLTASEIAGVVGAAGPALRRLLRALTSVGILVEDEEGRFGNTPMGELLRSDHRQSVRDLAIWQGQFSNWVAWGDLYETILTGEPAFDRIHGESLFDYLQKRPEVAASFNRAMTRGSSNILPAILEAYDFGAFSKVVDVAGGQGALLRGILEQFPQATGVLCDLPSVLDNADVIKNSPVAERCEFVGVDIFQSVPPGGDAYLLKFILHDWSDTESIQILGNCRQAIRDEGKLLVIERVIKPPNQPDPAKWQDLNMLVHLTGRERTAEEFGELFAEAGFRLTRVIPAGELAIIEGVPV